jgi:hypothetical protein
VFSDTKKASTMTDAQMTTHYMPLAVAQPDVRQGGETAPEAAAVSAVVTEPMAAVTSVTSSVVSWAGALAGGWAMYILAFLVIGMIIVAFVMAILAFVRTQSRNFGSLLSSWSWQTGLAAVSLTNQPLLFTVTNVTSTNQQDTSSFVPAPYDGYLQTLSCEFNAGLTSGSALFTVYIGERPSGLCVRYSTTSPDVFVQSSVCDDESCNRFCKGQKISVKMTTDTLTSSAPPFKVTCQVFGKGK